MVSLCQFMLVFVNFYLFWFRTFGHAGIFPHIVFSTSQYAALKVGCFFLFFFYVAVNDTITALVSPYEHWNHFLPIPLDRDILNTVRCFFFSKISVRVQTEPQFCVLCNSCQSARHASELGQTVPVSCVTSEFHAMLAQFEVCDITDIILPCWNWDCALRLTSKICLPSWRKTAKFLPFYLAIFRFLLFPRSWASKNVLCFFRGGQKQLKHVDRARKPLITSSQLHLFFF